MQIIVSQIISKLKIKDVGDQWALEDSLKLSWKMELKTGFWGMDENLMGRKEI